MLNLSKEEVRVTRHFENVKSKYILDSKCSEQADILMISVRIFSQNKTVFTLLVIVLCKQCKYIYLFFINYNI